MEKYNHSVIEPNWQSVWEKDGLFKADIDSGRNKYYILTMYPYPSGTLHMGHVINYTIGDALVRYHIMKGDNVLSPMGWDSFGLPAENAAIREKVQPREYTVQNINKMREQMRKAGWGYDWDREIATSHPGYYRWTQWIFLQLFAKDMAFKKNAAVNWCPSCNTVLANEQVKEEACERCNTPIEPRQLNQWFFRMSAYAQKLLDNQSQLKGHWPDRVLKMQEEWIGRSEGTLINFKLDEERVLPIFTTRPDTVFGVTFMAISPHHPLLEELISGRDNENELLDKIKELRKQPVSIKNVEEITKVGIDTGVRVTNPLNGDEVQLWVANFVLMEYGTGIIMAVPAHDQRDFEFAAEYNIPVKVVIQPEGETLDPGTMEAAYVDNGIMVNSGPFDGRQNREAISDINDYIENEKLGQRQINYKLKDWLLSRQRYWGAPIPIINCPGCGQVPVPDADLPVLLPDNVEFKPTGESPLKACEAFVNTECPSCGKPAQRETDTMDTFVDSSWYFLRYLTPRNEDAAWDQTANDYWMSVDQYIGGVEHATMHLVYFRFLMHALKDLGLVSLEEPAKRLFCQGMVCKVSHYCEECKWRHEDDVDLEKGLCRTCGKPVKSEMSKISKTKLNTVSPDAIINDFGADTMRLNILADNPPDQEQVWNDDSVHGCFKFVNRLYHLIADDIDALKAAEAMPAIADLNKSEKALNTKLHQTILKATECFEGNMHFNTVIAGLYSLINTYRNSNDIRPAVRRAIMIDIIKMFAPIIPHVCEELWKELSGSGSVFKSGWPIGDPDLAQEDTVEIVVQINGKVRSRLTVDAGIDKAALEAAALADAKIQEMLDGKETRKIIAIPGKLVNIVI